MGDREISRNVVSRCLDVCLTPGLGGRDVESTSGADLLCHIISGSAKCGVVTNLRTSATCHPDDPALAEDAKSAAHNVGTSLVHQAVTEIKAAGVGLAVIGTGGDPGHAPARALYEKLNFNAFRHVRYYRKL